jgi:hypothetical protein
MECGETGIAGGIGESFSVCFECGACYSGGAEGGSFLDEISWSIVDARGTTIAEATEDSSASFCAPAC